MVAGLHTLFFTEQFFEKCCRCMASSTNLKMKTRLILILLITATAAAVFGQKDTNYRFSIKLYNLATLDHTEEFRPTYPRGMTFNHITTDDLQLLHPAIAFQWKTKKHNFQEVELSELKWDHTGSSSIITNDSTKTTLLVAGDEVARSSVMARYEYILTLGKKKSWKLSPAIGFAASPYYTSYHFSPRTSPSFPESRTDLGLRVFVVPHLTWSFGKRMYLDMNVPVCVSDLVYVRERKADPLIPDELHRTEQFDMSILPRYFSARVGIGIKI
jgi:hypothetical protein